ncbi:PH domain-containing protein [Gottfriedia luciferensis]|uniref:PH domain-containing protein n=1 Tax=Gottfriedia luciferensis TaxID=178774 RepID=UPI000B43C17B|nr:PH domain-containing protein [Gottfriedia luciferensis]
MRSVPSQRPSLKMRSVWRITSLLSSLSLVAIPFIYYFLMRHFSLSFIILMIISGVVLALILLLTLFLPTLKLKYTAYEIYENELEIQKGIFVIKRIVIPMVRVQHVTTEVGPLLRRYGLSTVNISTAATTHKIEGLEHHVAEKLRDKIIYLARISDDDV